MEVSAPIYNPFTAFGIGGLSLLMVLLCLIAYKVRKPKHFVLVIAWIVFTAAVALSGLAANFEMKPPPFVITLALFIGIAFWIGLSKFGKETASNTSLAVLVGLQAFRFPLEIIMHKAYEAGIMPVQLSYSGYNFDIFSGFGALVIGFMLWRGFSIPDFVIWAWNVVGIICLAVIAIVAVAGSPIIQAFGTGPQDINSWVAYFPYYWLPTILVLIAILGHILVTRKLLSRKNASAQ